MSPEERQLISGLFDRMRDFGAPEKEAEAAALIDKSVRAMPDAPYMLVQSVLVQEQALQAATARINELEAQVRDQERGERRTGGFLGGGLFGGNRSEARGSVPQIGSKASPSVYEGGRSAWSQSAAPAQQPAQPATPAASGGFMRSALATAAGVAGGMLLADSIRNMLGSSSAHASSGSDADKASGGQDAGYSDKSGAVDERNNDPGGTYDANDPGYDSSDFGGDLDI